MINNERSGPESTNSGPFFRSDTADQQFALVDHLRRQVVVQVDEQFLVAEDFLAPRGAVHFLHLLEILAREVESRPFHVVEVGRPADGRLLAAYATVHAIHDPLEHAHVLAEARPQEFAVVALAEPVDVEDARRRAQSALHLEPVTEVVAHMVAAERQHGHGIAAHDAHRAGGRGRGLRTHGGAHVDAGAPVEGLVDERHGGRAASAEDERADGHALGIFPRGIDRGALRRGRGEAPVGMRGLSAGFLGNLRRLPTVTPAAAAVCSEPIVAPTYTPAVQLNAWKTSRMVVARRPPKMKALIGTPFGSSQAGSMVGHCEAGEQKREFG